MKADVKNLCLYCKLYKIKLLMLQIYHSPTGAKQILVTVKYELKISQLGETGRNWEKLGDQCAFFTCVYV